MARILDNILCTLMIFLLTFFWTVYCTKDIRLALLVAAVVALCACYIIYVALKHRSKNQKVKQNRKKLLESFATFLQFNADNSALFMPLFCYYDFMTKAVDLDNIIISKKERIFVSFCFQTGAVSLQQMQNCVVLAKRNNCDKLLVFCNRCDNALLRLANDQIATQTVDIANTYALFERADKLPKFPLAKRAKPQILPQFAFNRKRFGWYFFGAVFTLLTAAVSYIKIYLLVWSTALFALSLFCLFNSKYNTLPTQFLLD